MKKVIFTVLTLILVPVIQGQTSGTKPAQIELL
jgi:hypothetical protein